MILNKLLNLFKYNRKDLRSLPYSLYFNFHYLPFKQAIKLPILLYKPHFKELKGCVNICSQREIKYGMIRLGFPSVSIYPNTGIMIENHGGTILFKGTCFIGNNSAVSIGKNGTVVLGDRFGASTTLRLISYDRIVFGDKVRIGWDVLVMDTDFHKLTKLSGGYSRGHAPIEIGSNNWFGNGCRIMKRAKTPNHCVISAGTMIAEALDIPEYSVIGNRKETVIKASGMWRNVDDDTIEYNQ